MPGTQTMQARKLLRKLEGIRMRWEPGSVRDKMAILASLQKARFDSAESLHRYHDVLTFFRAYPDKPAMLELVEKSLAEFSQRSDLLRFRSELASSGIAGCPIDYRFFYPMAEWLANRFGEHLVIDWPEVEDSDKLVEIIPLLASYAESAQFDDFDYSARQWLQRLKNVSETDACFLIKRIGKLYRNAFEREALHDRLNLPYRLLPGEKTPSITHSIYLDKPVVYNSTANLPKRPDLRQVITRHPVSIKSVSTREGKKLIDLARTAMLTHERDLDAFSWGSAHDVRLVDCGEGLQFACIGTVAERRYLLPAVYGFLNLKNGVPIGYFQASIIFDMAEISFNTFSSFRGADAAHNYARALAMTRRLFGVRTFVLDNYQLGYDNKEGLQSGVWWFYYKLGFRPRNTAIKKLVRAELARMKHQPGHRSSLSTLNSLAEDYMYFELDRNKPRENIFPLSWNIAPGLSAYMAEHFGAAREAGLDFCALQAAKRLGLGKLPALSRDERHAWQGWAPLIMNLDSIKRWSRQNRRKVVAIIRAKASRRESDYVKLLAAHRPLQAAITNYAKQLEQQSG